MNVKSNVSPSTTVLAGMLTVNVFGSYSKNPALMCLPSKLKTLTLVAYPVVSTPPIGVGSKFTSLSILKLSPKFLTVNLASGALTGRLILTT